MGRLVRSGVILEGDSRISPQSTIRLDLKSALLKAINCQYALFVTNTRVGTLAKRLPRSSEKKLK